MSCEATNGDLFILAIGLVIYGVFILRGVIYKQIVGRIAQSLLSPP